MLLPLDLQFVNAKIFMSCHISVKHGLKRSNDKHNDSSFVFPFLYTAGLQSGLTDFKFLL